MHPQNKMQGSDPFYFHFIFIFFILKGASAPPFYLGTPDGGFNRGFGSTSDFGSQYTVGLLLG